MLGTKVSLKVHPSTRILPDSPFPNPSAVCSAGTDGRARLANPDRAAAIAVNRTGALIWRLVLSGRHSAIHD
jgi:hypothetical protein